MRHDLRQKKMTTTQSSNPISNREISSDNEISSDVAIVVKEVLESYPLRARKLLLKVRQLILEVASEIPEVGPLTETLKWGEPAYLTEKTHAGSTIRFAWKAKRPNQCALYFNCNTTLVSDFRAIFADNLNFEGKRAIVLDSSKPLPVASLKACIAAALTYHLSIHRRVAGSLR